MYMPVFKTVVWILIIYNHVLIWWHGLFLVFSYILDERDWNRDQLYLFVTLHAFPCVCKLQLNLDIYEHSLYFLEQRHLRGRIRLSLFAQTSYCLVYGPFERKRPFEHAQNAQIATILRKRKVSSGPLLSIHTFFSINNFCKWKVKALIRLRECAIYRGHRCPHMPEDRFFFSHGAVNTGILWRILCAGWSDVSLIAYMSTFLLSWCDTVNCKSLFESVDGLDKKITNCLYCILYSVNWLEIRRHSEH